MATGGAACKRDLPGKLAEHANNISPRLQVLVAPRLLDVSETASDVGSTN